MEASDPVGATQKGAGMRRGRFGRGKRKKGEKKSDGTCSFIRPFTPVATATCLEGTQERRHHWQKQQRGRELARATHSPNETDSVHGSGVKEKKKKVTDLRPALPTCPSTQRGVGLTFRVLSKKCNERSFITGGL